MDGMEMHGTPWMPAPSGYHMYRAFECAQNTTADCEYYQGYWHFWYEADHRFALPTVALFTATIILFALSQVFTHFAPKRLLNARGVRWKTALYRYLSYRVFRLSALNWNSAPLGVLLLGLVGFIFFMCMTLVPKPYYWPSSSTLNYWGSSPPLATRSGWLSLGCMPFVFLTAGKSNFITAITGVSHEKLQIFHRWISYAFFVTALAHTFPFIVYNIRTHQMVTQWSTNFDYWTGVVALLAQAWLTFASFGPLRNISYEFFKFAHFLAALVFMLFLFFHCGGTLSSWDYFVVTGIFFALSWLHRQTRIYFEHGVRTTATVSLVSNGFVCVRVPTKAVWNAGQHFFVRFIAFGIQAFSIHPFTACSLPSERSPDSELIFYIRPRGGLTARLAKMAATSPDSSVRVLLDGPYGGVSMRKLEQSRRCVAVAGGSGAGWLLPMLLTHLRYNELARKDGSTRSPSTMRIVLATRDVATREWFVKSVNDSLSEAGLDSSKAGVEIDLHFTGSEDPAAPGQFLQEIDDAEKTFASTKASSSNDSDSNVGSATAGGLKQSQGRPDLPSLVRSEVDAASDDQLGFFVCGPLSMQNDVSNTVAKAQIGVLKGSRKDIYLHMEHFSWA